MARCWKPVGTPPHYLRRRRCSREAVRTVNGRRCCEQHAKTEEARVTLLAKKGG